MANRKKVYATTNNKKNNVTGDLNLDGKGPDGGAAAFEKSREKVLLEYIISHIVREFIEQGQKISSKTSNITQVTPPEKTSKTDTTLSGAKTQSGFVSKAEKEAQRLAAWEEIEDLRQHLEDMRRLDAERSAKMPSKVGIKKQRMIELPPLPANLTAEFVKRVNNIVSWLEKSDMPPENRFEIDNQIYQIVADASKTEKQKIKDIKNTVGAQLNLINKAKMHLSNLSEDQSYQELMEL